MRGRGRSAMREASGEQLGVRLEGLMTIHSNGPTVT